MHVQGSDASLDPLCDELIEPAAAMAQERSKRAALAAEAAVKRQQQG